LFRIDRRFVKLAGTKISKRNNDEKSEADAEGDLPDAAALSEKRLNEYLYAAEMEMNAQAQEVVDEAREKAAEIIEQAKKDAQDERKRAYNEGFAEGSEEGKHSYDEQLAEKISEDDEMLRNILSGIEDERERAAAEMENDMINLSIEIVRKIFNPAEEELGNVYTSLIKNALRQMPTDGKLVIRVSPVEYERFFSSGAATIELDSGTTVKASVIRDVSLDEGDCIIDTDDVTINAGLESQLKYVKLAFERANQYEPE
jgi:flagellar biosynthesis/type III secretory pathway protein FliH